MKTMTKKTAVVALAGVTIGTTAETVSVAGGTLKSTAEHVPKTNARNW